MLVLKSSLPGTIDHIIYVSAGKFPLLLLFFFLVFVHIYIYFSIDIIYRHRDVNVWDQTIIIIISGGPVYMKGGVSSYTLYFNSPQEKSIILLYYNSVNKLANTPALYDNTKYDIV